MADYATKLAEGFSQKVVQLYFNRSISDDITNKNYEGEIKDKLSKLNIITFAALGIKEYNGSDITADTPQESVGALTTDQMKAFYFTIPSISRFKSWIKNPESSLMADAAETLKQTVDNFNLSFYTDVAAGQRIGTNVDDATTITVTNTTGAFVVAGGTPVTDAWVGRGIKCVGHTKWYRVKSVSSTTEGVIEDDLDDVTSAYTGGAISGGTSYVVEAVTAVQVTMDTLYEKLVAAKTLLDAAGVPEDGRYVVLPAELANLFLTSKYLIPAVGVAYEEVIRKGIIGMVAGFMVYRSEQVTGATATGWHCIAAHKSFITHAFGLNEVGTEDAIGNFGKKFKSLHVYGSKVVDERRKCGVELFIKL
jgi:hypothetical protein